MAAVATTAGSVGIILGTELTRILHLYKNVDFLLGFFSLLLYTSMIILVVRQEIFWKAGFRGNLKVRDRRGALSFDRGSRSMIGFGGKRGQSSLW